MRALIAIPVYNEERHVRKVLDRVLAYASDIVIVDDGSTDATTRIVAEYRVNVLRRVTNRGYGRSLREAFSWAACQGFDWVISMDCDDQHEPESLPDFLAACERDDLDIISGSRYLPESDAKSRANGHAAASLPVPPDRRAINETITREINERLGPRFGIQLTDSFCGFKAHRVEAIRKMSLSEDGYAFPMQFWVQAAALSLRIGEMPVPLIYNDLKRSFGVLTAGQQSSKVPNGHMAKPENADGASANDGSTAVAAASGLPLDDPKIRLAHYRRTLHRELRRYAGVLPPSALDGLCSGVGCSASA